MNSSVSIARLKDGRQISWAEYGDPSGRPVFYFHGGGSSHLEGATLAREAAQYGVRLLATDRPGVGRSSPNPAQSPLAYASDVAELADHLGLDRFAVAGTSNGGIFAMAAAHALPERVLGAVLINPSTPVYGDDEARSLSPETTRQAYDYIRDHLEAMIDMVLQSPPDTPQTMAEIPPSTEPEVVALFLRIRENVSRVAMQQELTWGGRYWGFDHTAVSQEVIFLVGLTDGGGPYDRRWVERLPRANLETFPGGHMGFLAPEARAAIVKAMASVGKL